MAPGCGTKAVVCEACAVRLLQPGRRSCRMSRRAWTPGDACRTAAMPAPSPQSSGKTLHAHRALAASHERNWRAGQPHSQSGACAALSTMRVSHGFSLSSTTCILLRKCMSRGGSKHESVAWPVAHLTGWGPGLAAALRRSTLSTTSLWSVSVTGQACPAGADSAALRAGSACARCGAREGRWQVSAFNTGLHGVREPRDSAKSTYRRGELKVVACLWVRWSLETQVVGRYAALAAPAPAQPAGRQAPGPRRARKRLHTWRGGPRERL